MCSKYYNEYFLASVAGKLNDQNNGNIKIISIFPHDVINRVFILLFLQACFLKCINIISWRTKIAVLILVKSHEKLPTGLFCLRPGRSPTVDVWSPSLRGLSGRLISYTQPPSSTEYCLSFFYKLYGPNAGKDRREVKGEGRRKEQRFKVAHLIQVLWMWS